MTVFPVMNKLLFSFSLLILITGTFQGCKSSEPDNWHWEILTVNGEPTARHEAGVVAYKDKLVLLGGRRINPTSVFDTKTNTWSEKSAPPIEIHHFQPVVYNDAIYIVGAMTGGWPTETPLDRVLIYYPEKDQYVYGDTIPEHRRRGGAGVIVHQDVMYIVGGITNGHMDGFQPWLDRYDPKSGEWTALPDAPSARDHFQAVVKNGKIYAFAGRTTSKRTNQDMTLTNSHGNVYDIQKGEWEVMTNQLEIPTQRAGNAAFVWGDQIVIGGGESGAQVKAHAEIEAYDTKSGKWKAWPQMNEGRHGTGYGIIGNYVYVASGCGNRGGEPELTTLERLELPSGTAGIPITKTGDDTPVYARWHTVTIPFDGPMTSEMNDDNPFLNYRLLVDFTHDDQKMTIPGYYAADGKADATSAKSGNVWEVRFTPPTEGDWNYSATLYHGDSIALATTRDGEEVSLTNSTGKFHVIASDKDRPDFRGLGRMTADNGYFRFAHSGDYWIKAGTNSPENLLGYVDFDDTYRVKAEAREGEAAAPQEIHSYEPHLDDWKTGDPTWKNGKGKSIVGAINYLASKGMNSEYFLTMNILGDGKDVWPYVSHKDFTRFDVSKLAQWEILFQHMQSKGVMLHMVLQETENETMLDGGDTGPLRQLYFRELIARFGHHLGLVWNLGEENGPADWSPVGQNDAQRKAMAKYISENDTYNHPVLLHTHSHDPLRADILNDIKGYKYLDGLSLQQDHRKLAADVVATWRRESKAAGRPWLITMDEIGMWHTAVLSDSQDPWHPTIRRYALWGTLLSGGAGVEWYFGARHPHNDLTSEDWRQRDQLWTLTNNARLFFDQYLPYWEMEPDHQLVSGTGAYCLQKEGEVYAIYLPDLKKYSLNLSDVKGEFDVQWYDPINGGDLEYGSVKTLLGGQINNLGVPPKRSGKDWVLLVKKKDAE